MVEKRRFVRVVRAIRIRYRVLGDPANGGEVHSKNVSATGVCLSLNDFLPVGSHLELALDMPGVPQPVEAQAKIIWIDKLNRKRNEGIRGSFEAGLKFTSMSSLAKSLIIKFVWESLKEREGVIS